MRGVLGLACICYIIRFLYYALMKDPWMVMPAEVLHGITFAAMWAARYGLKTLNPKEAFLGVCTIKGHHGKRNENGV